MNLYILYLRKYYWILLICLVVGCVAGLVAAISRPQTFQASAMLIVESKSPGTSITTASTPADPLQSQAAANTYAAEIQSQSMMQYVYTSFPKIKQMGYTPDLLLAKVSASASASAAILTVTATAPSADTAVELANDVAQGFQMYEQKQAQAQLDALRTNLQNQEQKAEQDKSSWDAKLQSISSTDPHYTSYTSNRDQDVQLINSIQQQLIQIPPTISGDVTVTQLATITSATSSLKTPVIIAIGGASGVLIGAMIFLLLVFLDDRLLTGEQIKEKLGLAYLGNLSHAEKAEIAPGHMSSKALRECAAIYANLRLTGMVASGTSSVTLLVTSTEAAEGKTTLAVALATLAARGGRTLVIDGNLQQPATHLAFSLNPGSMGLSDLLQNSDALEHVIKPTNIPNVWLLSVGTPFDEPTFFLEQRLPAILTALRQRVEMIIIDGPALLGGAEASIIASIVDSVALVVDARYTKRPLLLRAKDLLCSLTQAPTGIILNHHDDQYYAAPVQIDARKGAMQSEKHTPTTTQANSSPLQAHPSDLQTLAQMPSYHPEASQQGSVVARGPHTLW